MTAPITASELRKLLENFPDEAVVLVRTDSGSFAEIERPSRPGDNAPPFSSQEMEPTDCYNRANLPDGLKATQTAICLRTGKHWRPAH